MNRAFSRSIDALAEVFRYLDGFAEANAMLKSDRFAVSMAVEELFTNMVKYNPGGSGDIEIELVRDGKAVEIILVDLDSEPFDVTADRRVDVSAALDERSVGGLGLHLVQQMMDQIHYNYQHRRTEIRLVKQLT